MKRIIMFVLLFAALKVAGQTTGYLRFDTVKIMKQNGTCELYVINKTKDSLGLLTNVGGGLTQFKKPRSLSDSTILVGNDTLLIRGTGGGGTNLANAALTANDDYTHNWAQHQLFIDSIPKLRLMGYGPDTNFPTNIHTHSFEMNNSVGGTPLELKWAFRDIDNLHDSIGFQITSEKNSTTLSHYGNNGNRLAYIDFVGNSGFTRLDMQAYDGVKSSTFTLGSTTTISPGDSLRIKAIPAATADSVLGIRALSGGTNTVVKFPTPSGGGSGITALTGPVTASGPGSAATSITNNAISNAMIRQSAGISLVGRAANSTGNVADITATTANTFLGYNGTSLTFGDPMSTISSTYIAYVDSASGNNSTGQVNNIAKPFRTANGALDATVGLLSCIIHFSTGHFDSPDSAKMRSNIWIQCSGMPTQDDIVTNNAYYNNTVATPTKLIGGTIFNGSFIIPFNRENITMTDCGIDVGSDWVTNVNGGTAVDGMLCAQKFSAGGGLPSADGKHELQVNTKPRRNMQWRNIRVLLASPTSPYHAFLVENSFGENADNIYTTNGFAGVVIKSMYGRYTNLHTQSHGTYHIIGKSNDYSGSFGTWINGFTCKYGVGTGLTFDQGDAGSPGIYWCSASNGFINLTSGGMSLTGDNMNISNVSIVQGGSVLSSNMVRSSVSNVINRLSSGVGFDIDPGASAVSPTIWSNCTAIGSVSDGFYVHGGAARNDFEIISSENGGYGLRSNGSAYVGNHTYYNNTAGATTGTMHNRVEITGLVSAGSGVSISGAGTEASPYSISASGGSGTLQDAITAGATLSSVNTIAAGNNAQTFTGTQAAGDAYTFSNSGNGGAVAVSDNGSGIALKSNNSGSGTSIFGQANSGTAGYFTSTTGLPLYGAANPSSTNSAVTTFMTARTTSGTAAAGLADDWVKQLEDDAGNVLTASVIRSAWTSAATGAASADFQVLTLTGGSLTNKFTIKPTGQINALGYGSLSHTGTPVASLQVTSGDDIIVGPLLAAGTYTPTLTGVTNVTGTTAYACQYLRVGNVVTVSGKLNIDFTTTGLVEVGISLPIASSISNDFEIAGTVSTGENSNTQGAILGDATNNRAHVALVTPSSAGYNFFFTFTYQVL